MSNPLSLAPHAAVCELIDFLNGKLCHDVDNQQHFDAAWDYLCSGVVSQDASDDYMLKRGVARDLDELDDLILRGAGARYMAYLDARQAIAVEATRSLMVERFKVDLNRVEWRPNRFADGYEFFEYMDQGKVFLSRDWARGEHVLGVELDENGKLYSSQRRCDWPVLDALFGREKWLAYLHGVSCCDVEVADG